MDHVAPEIWATQFLLRHPARVHQAKDAKLFFIPVWPLLSKFVGNSCGQGSHDERMRKANSAIRGSQHWRQLRGRHFVLAAGPRAQWALGGELRRSLRGSILANEEGWGGLEWCARVIVPYFGHSKLAGATMERVLRRELGLPPMRSRNGGSAAAEDDARPEPDLAAPAFSMGAADGAPQEGRMVDFQDVWGAKRYISLYYRGTYSMNAGHEPSKKDPKGQDVRVKLLKLGTAIPHSMIKMLPVKSGVTHRLQKATQGAVKAVRDPAEYAAEIQSSQFCLAPRGDTLTSRRFYDAVLAGCIPIVLSDDMPLPFREELDSLYRRAVIFIPLGRFMASPVSTIRRAMEEASANAGEYRRALFDLRQELRYGSGSPFKAHPEFGGAVPHIVRAVHRRAERAADCQDSAPTLVAPARVPPADNTNVPQANPVHFSFMLPPNLGPGPAEPQLDNDLEAVETRRIAERTRLEPEEEQVDDEAEAPGSSSSTSDTE